MSERLTDEEFEVYADKVMDMSERKLQWIVWRLMREIDRETIDRAIKSAEQNVSDNG